MKLNVTTILAGVLIVILGILYVGKANTSRKQRKTIEAISEDNISLEQQLYTQIGANEHLLDKAEQLSLSISTEKSKRTAITASYRDLKSKLAQTPTKDIYTILMDDIPLTGEVYEIDSARVYDYGLTKLEMKECNEVVTSLLNENKLLKSSVEEYSVVASKLLTDLDDCTIRGIKASGELEKVEREKEKLKGKMWNNRSIAGVLGVALIVIAIL